VSKTSSEKHGSPKRILEIWLLISNERAPVKLRLRIIENLLLSALRTNVDAEYPQNWRGGQWTAAYLVHNYFLPISCPRK